MSENTKSNPPSDSARLKKDWTPPKVRAYGNIHDITLAVRLTGKGTDGSGRRPAKSH
jgi:hypothetical protein